MLVMQAYRYALDLTPTQQRLVAAHAGAGQSGPVAARGADRKTQLAGQVAVKREPGTASAGKTGTVPPQGRTTNRVHTKAH
jgi:hypothetical protein